MDDPVFGSLEVGGEMRQAARQAAKEAVVEPPNPRLAGPDHPRLASFPGDDVKVTLHIDDAKPGDQVSGHPARHEDIEAAIDQVDHQADLAAQFVAGEVEPVAPHQLRSDAQHPLQPQICEDSAGHVADANSPPRGHPQRHAHRPWREPAAPLGPSSVHTIRTFLPVILGNRADGRSRSTPTRTSR